MPERLKKEKVFAMKKGAGKNSRGGVRALGDEDFLLWKAFTRDIDPLDLPDSKGPVQNEGAAPQQNPTLGQPAISIKRAVSSPPPPYGPPAESAQLDARTEARLRRGKMPVEARLDLHGMTQDQAHSRLNEFVCTAHARGKRCILVITGKGLSRKGDDAPVGILRQKLPLWISMSPLREIVLKYYPAAQRDGGTGAWYLYLKRQRDY